MYWFLLKPWAWKRTGYQHTVAGDFLVHSIPPGKNSLTAGTFSACLWLQPDTVWSGGLHSSSCSSTNAFQLHYITLIWGLSQTMCPVFRSCGDVCSSGISMLFFNRIIMIQYWSCNAKIYSQIRFFLSRRWWEDGRTGQWPYTKEFALVWSNNLCGAV